MEGKLPGVLIFLVGCLILVFHKYFTKLIVEQQNKFWGFHFGERTFKITKLGLMMTGAGFIILGLLTLFQVLRFR